MPNAALFIQEFGPWLLVFNRVLGLFLFTPLLTSSAVPMRFRVLLGASFAVAIYGFLPDSAREMPEATLWGHVMMMFGEIMIGACIGFIAGLPLVAIEMAGHLIGHQMALSLAQSYNPELDANLNAIGSMLFYMGISTFVLIGGAESVLTTIADSFSTLPIGGFDAALTPVDLVLGVLTAGTEIAIRVAAPVIAIIMAILVALGFVMKTMPQINVMSVGFAIKIMGGICILMFSLFAVNEAVSGHIVEALNAASGWVDSLGPGGGGGG